MNAYQRIKAALDGRWSDQRPVMLHNFMWATRQAGYTMRDYYTKPQVAAEVHIRAAEKYKLDGILIDIDTAVMAAAMGAPVDYPEDDPARVHGQLLTSLEAVNDMPEAEIAKCERVQILLETTRIIKKHFGDELFIRGNCDQAPFSLASMLRTPADWLMDLLTNEALAFKLLNHCETACLQMIDLMAAENVHMISHGDSPAGPDMISPEMYRRFALPYERSMAKHTHDAGLYYLIHICGNTDLILQDMKSIGADAVELDYKTNLQQVYEHFHQQMVLFGNIDPTGVLTEGTPSEVAQKTRQLLNLYKNSPRLVVNAGCAIPPTAPEENIRAMIETTRND